MCRPFDLAILGPPLCGKGNHANLIVKELGLCVISTGQIFRDAMNRNSKLGREVRNIVHAGKLVPDDIVIRAVKPRFDSWRCRRGFVLDGFPRTMGQLNFLEKLLSQKRTELKMVVLLQITKEEMFKRSTRRKRIDDRSPKVLETRWKVYQNETVPVISWYRHNGCLLEINGISPIPKVWARIRTQIQKKFRRL